MYVGVCSDTGAASVNRKPSVMRDATVSGYYSFIVQAKTLLPILFLKSSAELKPDAGRFAEAYGSFWDNG